MPLCLTERKKLGWYNTMAKNGLDKWFAQKWVDIGSKRKDGSFAKCGRSKQKKDAKRKYPKCVPLAKARRMTEGQRRSAVSQSRSVSILLAIKPPIIAFCLFANVFTFVGLPPTP